jgi:hypothetical protein
LQYNFLLECDVFFICFYGNVEDSILIHTNLYFFQPELNVPAYIMTGLY